MHTGFWTRRRSTVLLAAALTAAAVTGTLFSGSAAAAATGDAVCPRPTTPNTMQCYAIVLHRTPPKASSLGAVAPGFDRLRRDLERHSSLVPSLGPVGGYTPDDLAIAYNFNPNLSRTSQTVGIVDWDDDPDILSDLNKFDAYYHRIDSSFPAKETSKSFRKVNQNGSASPLPRDKDHGGSVEISLDVESVRAVCHTCRILLVEANTASDTSLATAENTAAALGATEISNSYGGPEGQVSSKVLAAYNHPGVVITASAGDDGWFGWDYANLKGGESEDGPSFPASDPHVVSVGGTTLALNDDGSRAEETVWNDNGIEDSYGLKHGNAGATGGGCSSLYTALAIQASFPGYAAASCGGERLVSDVSAIGDPETGIDILDNFAPGARRGKNNWLTVGGTSLASPVTAAMFALAGGSGGAAYPATSIYANASLNPSSVYDVVPVTGTPSGNGFCADNSTADCQGKVLRLTKNRTSNPNARNLGLLDCSFPFNNSNPQAAPTLNTSCNAAVGYDGPSGVGTPTSLQLFAPQNPTVTLTPPALITANQSASFSAVAAERTAAANADGQITSYAWSWGDGESTTTTTGSAAHTYTKAGKYKVTLIVTDSLQQMTVASTTVTAK